MSVEAITETMSATGRRDLPSGNFFKLKTATAAVNLRIVKNGISEGVNGESSNVTIRRITPWERAELIAAAGTVYTILYGTELSTMQDVTDITTTSSQISGVTVVEENTTLVVASPAVATRATAGADVIAANLNRRRIYISNISGEAGSGGTAGAVIHVQTTGAGARRGIPVQDGQTFFWDTTDTFDIRNDSGVTAAYAIQELV